MKFIILITLALTGCQTFRHDASAFDRSFRTRIKSFTLTEFVGPVGVSETWTYNTPLAK